MKDALSIIKKFLQEEEGLSAVEYAIAGALVIGVAAGGFTALGNAVDGQINTLTGHVNGG